MKRQNLAVELERLNGISVKTVERTLRKRVKQWKKHPPKSLKMVDFKNTKNFSQTKMLWLRTILTTIQVIEQLKNSTKPESIQLLRETENTLREFLKIAIYFGMFELEVIRENSIKLGVVPDPKTDWKFYREGEEFFCWECHIPAVKSEKNIACPKCGTSVIFS